MAVADCSFRFSVLLQGFLHNQIKHVPLAPIDFLKASPRDTSFVFTMASLCSKKEENVYEKEILLARVVASFALYLLKTMVNGETTQQST